MKKYIYLTLGHFVLPVVSFAQAIDEECPDGQLCNPLKGVGSLTGLIEVVLKNIILPIGSVVIVIMIIYSGFLFVTARGNSEKIEDARRTFLYVVIGAAILLGAWMIAEAISGTLCQITGILCSPPSR